MIRQTNNDETPILSDNVLMSPRIFKVFSEFIYAECGIKMPPAKKTMLESRLRKRLKPLGLKNFEQYADYVFSTQGKKQELFHMIDLVTTNKTDFFREPAHFDYLYNTAVPQLLRYGEGTIHKRVNVWSAASSTGEEPYTLAIVLSEFAEKHRGFSFSVLATDISTRVLDTAKKGIYDMDKVEGIPLTIKQKYFLRNRNKEKNLVMVAPSLKSFVHFRRLNLMDSNYGISQPIDIIFCRNVFIYFDRPTQEKILHRFARYLTPQGFLFMGHSETLSGMNIPFIPVAPTIYRRSS